MNYYYEKLGYDVYKIFASLSKCMPTQNSDMKLTKEEEKKLWDYESLYYSVGKGYSESEAKAIWLSFLKVKADNEEELIHPIKMELVLNRSYHTSPYRFLLANGSTIVSEISDFRRSDVQQNLFFYSKEIGETVQVFVNEIEAAKKENTIIQSNILSQISKIENSRFSPFKKSKIQKLNSEMEKAIEAYSQIELRLKKRIDFGVIRMQVLGLEAYEEYKKSKDIPDILEEKEEEKPVEQSKIMTELKKIFSDIKKISIELDNETEVNLVVQKMIDDQKKLYGQTLNINEVTLSLTNYDIVLSKLLVDTYGYYLDLKDTFKAKSDKEKNDESINDLGIDFIGKETIDSLFKQMHLMSDWSSDIKPQIDELETEFKSDTKDTIVNVRKLLSLYSAIQNNYSTSLKGNNDTDIIQDEDNNVTPIKK